MQHEPKRTQSSTEPTDGEIDAAAREFEEFYTGIVTGKIEPVDSECTIDQSLLRFKITVLCRTCWDLKERFPRYSQELSDIERIFRSSMHLANAQVVLGEIIPAFDAMPADVEHYEMSQLVDNLWRVGHVYKRLNQASVADLFFRRAERMGKIAAASKSMPEENAHD